MQGFIDKAGGTNRGLLGTWVKIPAFETVELLAHAGFDFVVLDMEHAPLALDRTYELIFATQRMGMSALVRLPDQLGTPVQPLLDAGTPTEAKQYLDMGYSLVMVSNDATLFGRAAAELVRATRQEGS